MKLFLTLGLILPIACFPSFGNTFSSTCDVSGSATVTGTMNCLSIPTGQLNPDGSIPANIPLALAQTTSDVAMNAVTVSQFNYVYAGFASGGSLTAPPVSALSQVSISQTLTTPGPVRQGVVKIDSLSNDSFKFNGTGSGTFSLLFPGASSSILATISCDINRSCNLNQPAIDFYNQALSLTVLLGTPFDFNYSSVLNTSVGGNNNYANLSADTLRLSFAYSLFEADGTTPVAVLSADAPEPGLLALAGMVILITLGMARKRLSA